MRDKSVTIAKALAIIFMVLGHSNGPDIINNYLQIIRMPLFFFMSGYCFKVKYINDSTSYLKKRFTGIYFPYVKWSLIFLLFHNILFHLNIYNDSYGYHGITSTLYNLNDYIFHASHIILRFDSHDQLLGGYWFLKSLFWGSLIFYFTLKILRNAYIGLIVLLIITIFMSKYSLEIPFWYIKSREFFAAFFIMSGHIAKKINILHYINNYRLLIIGMIIVGIGSIIIHSSLNTYKFYEIVPFAMFSLTGTLSALYISSLLSKYNNRIIYHIDYIGKHTFQILTWHFLSMKLVSLLIIFLYKLPIERLAEFPNIYEYSGKGWWILYLLIGVELPIIWMKLYEHLKDINYFKIPKFQLSK